jgi:hypothetical protein
MESMAWAEGSRKVPATPAVAWKVPASLDCETVADWNRLTIELFENAPEMRDKPPIITGPPTGAEVRRIRNVREFILI